MAPPWLGEKPGGCVRFGVRALFHPARCVLVGFTAGGKLFHHTQEGQQSICVGRNVCSCLRARCALTSRIEQYKCER